MAITTGRLFTSFFFRAVILLFLLSGLFSFGLIPSFGPSTWSLGILNRGFTPVLVATKASDLAQKVAVPFGTSNALRLSNSSSSSRVRRVANWEGFDSTWVNAFGTGVKLLELIKTQPRFDSPFQRVTDLTGPNDLSPAELEAGHGKGWRIDIDGDVLDQPDEYTEIYQHLGIPLGNENEEHTALQSYPFWNCRRQNNVATNGNYKMSFNVQGKALVALTSWSPTYMIQKKFKTPPQDWAEQLPDVNRQSDIMWILWKNVAGDAAKDLKYIFRHTVVTQFTKDVMDLVTGSEPGELNIEWPGRTFYYPNTYFIALMGTPHGRGIVYLLQQHASGLPGKDIESITVFSFDYEYHLLFTLTGPGN